MDGKASRALTDMDPSKRNHVHEELARKFSRANSSKTGCFVPSNRKTHRGNMKTLDGQGVETRAHEPGVRPLNLKPSLMGVQIYDDSEHFFSRQSSTASIVSEKFRSGVEVPCFSGREQGDGLQTKRGRSIVASSDAGKRAQSGTYMGDSNRSRLGRRPTTSFEKARAASGVLYPPSPQAGDNGSSSILNAVHFTFGDASATGSGRGTDKIYKQLLENARSHKCSHDGGLEMTQKSTRTTQRSPSSVAKQSFGSTVLSSSASLTFSERLFGYEFSRDSFRRQSQKQPDAKSAQASLNRATLTPQLSSGRQSYSNSMSIPAVSDYEDTDDDDIIIEGDIIFEIPSGPSFRCSHDQQHYAELVMVRAKPRPKSERWSSNKNSFHLNLKQQSMNGSGRQQHRSTTADPESRAVKARETLDLSHRDISLRSSFDGGSRRLEQLSSFPSERSGWVGSESDADDFVLDSGRLKIDVSYEPGLDLTFLEQEDKKLQPSGGVKLDEADFPFNSPIASSFLFEEPNGKKRSEVTHLPSMARTVVLEIMDYDSEDLDVGDDAFHDPEDESTSDTDSSLTTFSPEGDSSCSIQSQIDQHTQWISTRSFNYLREVVDHNSGFLNIESRSGRFSVDLRQEKWLGKVEHSHSFRRPGVRVVSLRRSAQSKRSKRSLLAPCLALGGHGFPVPRVVDWNGQCVLVTLVKGFPMPVPSLRNVCACTGLSVAENLDGEGRPDFEAVAGGTESFEKVSKHVDALAKISGPSKRSAVLQESKISFIETVEGDEKLCGEEELSEDEDHSHTETTDKEEDETQAVEEKILSCRKGLRRREIKHQPMSKQGDDKGGCR